MIIDSSASCEIQINPVAPIVVFTRTTMSINAVYIRQTYVQSFYTTYNDFGRGFPVCWRSQ